MKGNLARQTIYSILQGIESDLRRELRSVCGENPLELICTDIELVQTLKHRYKKEFRIVPEVLIFEDFIPFLDLSDEYKLINHHTELFEKDFANHIRELTQRFDSHLVKIRHRVCHFRPLHHEDLAWTVAFAEQLLDQYRRFWCCLAEEIQKQKENPSYIFGLDIVEIEEIGIDHNLPIPDFEDTGYVGRSDLLRKIRKHLSSSFPVISLVGTGGVGKTATALKICYELLDDPTHNFDAIVWGSAKNRELGIDEIRSINESITSSIDLIELLAEEAGGISPVDPIEDLITAMEVFNLLVVIDNLETILDQDIRGLIERIPAGSKVLITSRIGLGAYEIPIKLEGLSSSESINLMRQFAKLRDVRLIFTASNDVLERYCKRLAFNPGYIKWFVSALGAGSSPESILSKKNEFLDFCMSNVYEHLSDNAHSLLQVAQACPGWKTPAELSYLQDKGSAMFFDGLKELLATNFISERFVSNGVVNQPEYQLSDLSRSYLSRFKPVAKSIHDKIKGLAGRLTATTEYKQATGKVNDYRVNRFFVGDESHNAVIRKLSEALRHAQSKNFSDASKELEECKVLNPGFHEVFRVSAQVNAMSGNIESATSDFKTAIDLKADSPSLYFFYGLFLLEENRLKQAESVLTRAVELDPAFHGIRIALVRAYIYQFNYPAAEKLVLELVKQHNKLSWNIQRQVYMLALEIPQRKADYYAHRNEVNLAFESLSELQIVYRTIPSNAMDDFMLVRIQKLRPTLDHLIKICKNDSKLRGFFVAYRKWLE